MTDKQIIEYKHIKCTRDDCCHYCGSVFCGYVDDIENLEKAYKAKEQECEELKKIINEAKNSKLDLKSFLVGEAVQNEYEEQLDQLKAENEKLKESCKNTSTSLYAFMDNCSELHYKIRNLKNKYKKEITKQAKSILKLKQAIEKIKEIAQFACEKSVCDGNHCDYCSDGQIIAICDEVAE